VTIKNATLKNGPSTLEQRIAGVMRMEDRVWRRHANPWSVYTRFSMVPLLGLAFWSRVWLGWWPLIPIGLVLAWLWLNPRLFPPPGSTANWASKVVLGERIWMNRKAVPVPHSFLPHLLSTASAAGFLLFIWGLAVLDLAAALSGGIVVVLSKLWFAHRMVRLYDAMKDATPEYRSWLY
jgi:hypothetical protein